MDTIFSQEATAPVAAEAVDTAARKEKVAAMKASLKETVQTSPDFASKLRRLSNSIKVVNTLGYGKGGNIVVDKKASGDARVLKPTSAICGYKLENIGTEAIEYTTEVFSQDETGKFVGQVVTKQWNPGETISLTRQYMTLMERLNLSTLSHSVTLTILRKVEQLVQRVLSTQLRIWLQTIYTNYSRSRESNPSVLWSIANRTQKNQHRSVGSFLFLFLTAL